MDAELDIEDGRMSQEEQEARQWELEEAIEADLGTEWEGTEWELEAAIEAEWRLHDALEDLRRLSGRDPQIPVFEAMVDRLARPKREAVWRVEGWQQVGQRVMLAAQYKSGKTTAVINLVRSLLTGTPFLDRWEVTRIPRDQTLVVLDFEMAEPDRGLLDDWYEQAGVTQDSPAAQQLIVVPLRGLASTFDILNETVRGEWVERLRKARAGYLVLDCLRPALDALGLDEHRDVGKFLVPLDALLKEAGISDALVVHHMGHQSAENPRARARGDSRILDWPDVNWTLIRDSADDAASPRFIRAYGRGVDTEETKLGFEEETLGLISVRGSRVQEHWDRKIHKVLGRLTGEWQQTSEIEKGLQKGPVNKILLILVDRGLAEMQKGPHNAKLYRLKQVKQ